VPMGQPLIVSDNRENPGNPLIVDGQAIEEAARDPVAIDKSLVDQAWAEGIDPPVRASTTNAAVTDNGVCRPLRPEVSPCDRRLDAGTSHH